MQKGISSHFSDWKFLLCLFCLVAVICPPILQWRHACLFPDPFAEIAVVQSAFRADLRNGLLGLRQKLASKFHAVLPEVFHRRGIQIFPEQSLAFILIIRKISHCRNPSAVLVNVLKEFLNPPLFLCDSLQIRHHHRLRHNLISGASPFPTAL